MAKRAFLFLPNNCSHNNSHLGFLGFITVILKKNQIHGFDIQSQLSKIKYPIPKCNHGSQFFGGGEFSNNSRAPSITPNC